MTLPIEKNQELLKEYGRAFAYINSTEYVLNIFLSMKIGLEVDTDITDKILDEIMMGKKIKIVEKLLPPSLINKLWKLNNNRILLAHGVIVKKVLMDDVAIKTGELFVQHKEKEILFDKEFLKKTVELAQEIIEELTKEVKKIFKSYKV